MDQIFTDHYRFMVIGLVVATIMASLPCQTRWGLRFSRALLVLAGLYPIGIVHIYLNPTDCGGPESYGYLIVGALFGILLGIIAGIIALSWLVVYIRGIVRLKKSRGT